MRSVRQAFTLVELLVVIGIIALLLSILLPTLNRVRDSAQAVACASNMRQIHTALMLYGSNNQNFAMPAEGGSGSAVQWRWWGVEMIGAVWAKRASTGGGTSVDAEIESQHKYLRCPANQQVRANIETQRWFTTYTYNRNMGEFQHQTGTASSVDPSLRYKRRTAIPQNVIVMLDMNELPLDNNAERFLHTDDLLLPTRRRAGAVHRNKTMANVMFHSGHVLTVKPDDLAPYNFLIRADGQGRFPQAKNLGGYPF